VNRLMGIVIAISLICFGSASLASAESPFLKVAEGTGISITKDGPVIAWAGPYGGKIKPKGPLAGKKIGLVVGCEFSDWQAYYFGDFVGEFGGTPQFVMDNNHLWKSPKPTRFKRCHRHVNIQRR